MNMQRLGALEHELGSVRSEIAAVQRDVLHITQKIDAMATTFSSLAERVTESRSTNWGTLAAWATVIVGVLVYHNNLTFAPFEKENASIRQDIAELETELRKGEMTMQEVYLLRNEIQLLKEQTKP